MHQNSAENNLIGTQSSRASLSAVQQARSHLLAEALLREADVVSLHVPLTLETRGLIAEWDVANKKLSVLGATKVLFFNRRGDRVKVLWFAGDGLVIWYKKFESQYPHFLLFTETGGHANNFPCRLASAFGMDSHTPGIGPRRRPMSGEISVIVPPRAKFAAGP